MTSTAHRVTSGLVFLGMRVFQIVKIGNQVCSTLDRLDEQVVSLEVISDEAVIARTSEFELRIETRHDCNIAALEQPAAHFLALTLTRPEIIDPETTQSNLAIMAHVLQTLHRSLAPDYIQWVDPQALLSSAEFKTATTFPEDEAEPENAMCEDIESPAKVIPRRHTLPGIEETNRVLQGRLIYDDPAEAELHAGLDDDQTAVIPENDVREKTAPLRLSVWMMTITLGLFALPMAIVLGVINLVRGENLRFTSQATALTGTFLALHTFGTTAEAMSVVRHLLS